MFKRIKAISIKEIRQLKRDSKMLFVLFVFPVILLVLFGYAISFDVHHIQLGIYDREKSDLSREMTNMLTSSEYFDLVTVINDENDVKKSLDRQVVQAVLVFPENLSNDYYAGRNVKVQLLVDGVNGNTASIVLNYINLAVNSYSQKISAEVLSRKGRVITQPVSLEQIFWYNPTLSSTHFLIPGLIAMILIITAVVSISLSIVREKERGTIEQILVSPIKSLELLVGKTIPYVVIALFIEMMIFVASYFLFGLEIQGNLFLLALASFLFLFASLNLGIFVSSIANTQQVAFQIATLISMLPSVILSGFIFPIESMPGFIQVLTNITPAKFFVEILKTIVLKGAGFSAIADQMGYLIIFSFVFLMLATIKNAKMQKGNI